MAKALTADDILPLAASLTLEERERLPQLIASRQGADNARLAVRASVVRRVLGGRVSARLGREGMGETAVRAPRLETSPAPALGVHVRRDGYFRAFRTPAIVSSGLVESHQVALEGKAHVSRAG